MLTFFFCVLKLFFSSMLAVVLEDFTISIIDIDTRRTVRSFSGHSNTITDLVLYFFVTTRNKESKLQYTSLIQTFFITHPHIHNAASSYNLMVQLL